MTNKRMALEEDLLAAFDREFQEDREEEASIEEKEELEKAKSLISETEEKIKADIITTLFEKSEKEKHCGSGEPRELKIFSSSGTKGYHTEISTWDLFSLKVCASLSSLEEINKFPLITTSFNFEKILINKEGEPKMKLGCRKYRLVNVAYAQFVTSGEYRKQLDVNLPRTGDSYKVQEGDELLVQWVDEPKRFRGREIMPTYSSGEFIFVKLEGSIGKREGKTLSEEIENTTLYGKVLTDCIRATFSFGDYIVFGILNIATIFPQFRKARIEEETPPIRERIGGVDSRSEPDVILKTIEEEK